jgi:protein O-mannosyl-transferase
MKKGPTKKSAPKKGMPTKNEVIRKSYFNQIGFGIIILLGIIIYSNSFKCSFHFDDISNIVDNAKIHKLSDVKAWWNFVPTRPIGNLTFALNYHFNKLDVRYYHLVNLVIHLINACLVWWLTLLIFSSPAMKDQKIAKHKKILALITALLFVSHPLATQSVTYIVQRLASLATMFYLLSLALYVKARITEKLSKKKYLLFAFAFISAVAAMLTKEISFTLPFAILLFEFFFLRTKKLTLNLKDYRLYVFIAGLVTIITIILSIFTFSIFNPIPPEQGHTYTVTAYNYLLTQFSVIVKYIQLLFLPVNQMLDYDFPISNNFFGIRTLLSFLVLLALIILAIFLFKKHRIISFGIFWFFLTLSVESSFIPIPNLIFEHRTYLPSFGFFLILSSVIFILLGEKNKNLTFVILGIIIISNSYLTYERNKIWKDEFSLWNDNAIKTPNLVRPITSRGVAYAHIGQWKKALEDYTMSIVINPNYATAYFNRGNLSRNLNQWDNAIADYSKSIEIDSNYTAAYCNRGVTYAQFAKWDKAIADFSKAIAIAPDNTEAFCNRGNVYMDLKEWNKAIADYTAALTIDPNLAMPYTNREIAYKNLKNENSQ